MLKNAHLLAIQQAATLFSKVRGQWPKALAEQAEQVSHALADVVTDALQVRTEMAGRPRGSGKGRSPSTVYVVDYDGYEPRYAIGAAQAVDMVNGDLQELGHKGKLTANNLTTSISTKGEWSRKIATDNGDRVLAVRRVPDAAAAKIRQQYAEWKLAQESAQ